MNELQGMQFAVHIFSNHCETGGTPAAGAIFAFTPNIVIFQAILFYKHIFPPWRWLLHVPPKHFHISKDVITVMSPNDHNVSKKKTYFWLTGTPLVCRLRIRCTYMCSLSVLGSEGTALLILSQATSSNCVFSSTPGRLYHRNKRLDNTVTNRTEDWMDSTPSAGKWTTIRVCFSSYLSQLVVQKRRKLEPFPSVKVKVNFTLEQATMAQKGSRGITLLFL